jgi:DNA repair protein RadD
MARSLFEGGSLRPLRPRQATAIESIRQAVREGHRRIVLQAPTGFGKTLTAAHIIAASVARSKRPMFTCPAITLVNQTLKSFEAEGIRDIGVIQAQHERTDWNAQVQIASVQTLIRRALPEVDLVLIDEVHNRWAKFNERLDSEEWKDKVVIGLSATPWAKGMGLRWTKLVIAATIQELIDEGFLCQFSIQCPSPNYEPNMAGVKVKLGEFEEAGAARVMSDKKIVANVVETWLEKGTGDRTFLFAVNRAHAQALREEFQEKGVSCGYIDAFSDDDERKETFRRFRSREDKIIASVGCLTTGVDEDVRCIIDAAPTKSEILHVQKIGRGLRTAEGKDLLWILDHAGNTLRLGMVTDIYHDHLDVHKPQDKEQAYEKDKPAAKPKKCPNCHIVIPPGKRVCAFCKTELPFNHGVEQEEGELVLFEGVSQRTKTKQAKAEFDPQEFYSGFLGIAKQRGYSEGWAAHAYKEKFGVWPRNLDNTPKEPTRRVIDYDRHRRIKYAKGREKAQA